MVLISPITKQHRPPCACVSCTLWWHSTSNTSIGNIIAIGMTLFPPAHSLPLDSPSLCDWGRRSDRLEGIPLFPVSCAVEPSGQTMRARRDESASPFTWRESVSWGLQGSKLPPIPQITVGSSSHVHVWAIPSASSTLPVTYHPGFVTEVVDRMQRVNAGDPSILQPNNQTAVVSIPCHAEGMLADQHEVWLQRPGVARVRVLRVPPEAPHHL